MESMHSSAAARRVALTLTANVWFVRGPAVAIPKLTQDFRLGLVSIVPAASWTEPTRHLTSPGNHLMALS
jgi:hypothetical protein